MVAHRIIPFPSLCRLAVQSQTRRYFSLSSLPSSFRVSSASARTLCVSGANGTHPPAASTSWHPQKQFHSESENRLVDELNNLLTKSDVPVNLADFVFAYGSGAVRQSENVDLKDNMADFIIAVPDVNRFHSHNIKRNRNHYSAMKSFGAAGLAKFQKTWAPARIYFNTMVWIEDAQRLIKYGVIQTDDLLADLLDWDTLYVAGRLQKPVLTVKPPKSVEIEKALMRNLQSAVHTTLLLLPDTFETRQFYTTLAALSYLGDFRMVVGEDKNKVSKLVTGAVIEKWDTLYSSTLADLPQLVQDGGEMAQDTSVAGAYHHLNLLPKNVLRKMHVR